MRWSDIPAGEHAPSIVSSIIEIPQGSSNKYEYHVELDAFVLDRILFSPLYYPTDYGWIAGTLSEDGDPLDILVFISHPTFPGCVVPARPIGGLDMRDEEGEDFKVIGVAATDPRYAEVTTLNDLPPHTLHEIEHFFSIYKQLECKETEIYGWRNGDDARRIVCESIARKQSALTYQH